LNREWPTRKLRDIADVRVSNVDKKIYRSETAIKLCNYMDVYENDYVTGAIDFMIGSASRAEIERFAIQRADVIITKDSETPDDIGVPAVVIEDIPGLVCGYHLCLIRPKNDEIEPIYLAKQLGTSKVSKYFAIHARGSTRFGLPVGAIENLDVPFAPKPEQAKIAEILSTVDRAIEQTESLIVKQQRIKTGLIQDLLTRGIDEHGNLRSEETHEFKDSRLGRIPVEWEVETLGKVVGPIISGWSPTCDPVPAAIGEWAILKTTACVWSGYNQNENKRLPSNLRGISKIEASVDDILITRKGPVDRVGVVVHIPKTRSKLMIPDTVFKMQLNDDSNVIPAFLPIALGSATVQSDWFQKKIGLADAQVNLNHSILRATKFPKPQPAEQNLIVGVLKNVSEKVYVEQQRVEKLRSLKTALMQDLLSGKVPVTLLLENSEVGA